MNMTNLLPAVLATFLLWGMPTIAFSEEQAALPATAEKLRRGYDKAVKAATEPLRDKYIKELQKLQSDLSNAKKFDEVTVIQKEIERTQMLRFVGRWTGSRDGKTIEIDANQTATNGSIQATWKVEDGDLVLVWKNGYQHRYSIDQTGDTIQGKDVSPQGGDQQVHAEARFVSERHVRKAVHGMMKRRMRNQWATSTLCHFHRLNKRAPKETSRSFLPCRKGARHTKIREHEPCRFRLSTRRPWHQLERTGSDGLHHLLPKLRSRFA